MLQVWLARLVSAAHLPQSTSVGREGAAWKTPNAKHQCMQVVAKIMLSRMAHNEDDLVHFFADCYRQDIGHQSCPHAEENSS